MSKSIKEFSIEELIKSKEKQRRKARILAESALRKLYRLEFEIEELIFLKEEGKK